MAFHSLLRPNVAGSRACKHNGQHPDQNSNGSPAAAGDGGTLHDRQGGDSGEVAARAFVNPKSLATEGGILTETTETEARQHAGKTAPSTVDPSAILLQPVARVGDEHVYQPNLQPSGEEGREENPMAVWVRSKMATMSEEERRRFEHFFDIKDELAWPGYGLHEQCDRPCGDHCPLKQKPKETEAEGISGGPQTLRERFEEMRRRLQQRQRMQLEHAESTHGETVRLDPLSDSANADPMAELGGEVRSAQAGSNDDTGERSMRPAPSTISRTASSSTGGRAAATPSSTFRYPSAVRVERGRLREIRGLDSVVPTSVQERPGEDSAEKPAKKMKRWPPFPQANKEMPGAPTMPAISAVQAERDGSKEAEESGRLAAASTRKRKDMAFEEQPAKQINRSLPTPPQSREPTPRAAATPRATSGQLPRFASNSLVLRRLRNTAENDELAALLGW